MDIREIKDLQLGSLLEKINVWSVWVWLPHIPVCNADVAVLERKKGMLVNKKGKNIIDTVLVSSYRMHAWWKKKITNACTVNMPALTPVLCTACCHKATKLFTLSFLTQRVLCRAPHSWRTHCDGWSNQDPSCYEVHIMQPPQFPWRPTVFLSITNLPWK